VRPATAVPRAPTAAVWPAAAVRPAPAQRLPTRATAGSRYEPAPTPAGAEFFGADDRDLELKPCEAAAFSAPTIERSLF